MEKKSVFRRFLYSQKAAPYVFIQEFKEQYFLYDRKLRADDPHSYDPCYNAEQ